ncbi:MAG: MerR family transcriptional regulator [Rhodospirillales bacterium]|nr:MAG: MerR family transcriptional regulator [Rhodospirillales bacterium]
MQPTTVGGDDRSGKSPDAYRTIGEASAAIGVPQHVLRFWETRFSQVRPLKRAGNRRYYRPGDIALLKRIRQLLHEEGYSIRGVQRLLKSAGTKAVVEQGSTATIPQTDEPSATGGSDLQEIVDELVRVRDLLR